MPIKTNRSFSGISWLIEEQAPGAKGVWCFPNAGECWSHEQITLQSMASSPVLSDLGVGQGDRVGIAVDNGLDVVIAHLAVQRLGAVAVPLSTNGGSGYRYADFLQQLDLAVGGLKVLLYGDTAPVEAIRGWARRNGRKAVSVREVTRITESVDLDAPVRVRPDAPAILQVNSGSRRVPRPITITHGMLVRQIEYQLQTFRCYTGADARGAACFMPAYFDMGLTLGIYAPMVAGCDNLFATPAAALAPKKWLRLLSDHQVEVGFLTNSLAVMFCRVLERSARDPQIDLSRLHLILGAEPVQAAVLRRLVQVLAPYGMGADRVHVAYGLAPNTLIATRTPKGPVRTVRARIDGPDAVTVLPPNAVDGREYVSIGRAIADTRVRIQGGRYGELCISGPCVTPGCYPAMDRNGWPFKTGDLAFWDEGELFFSGRKDDLVIAGGVNLVPEDFEQAVWDLAEGAGHPEQGPLPGDALRHLARVVSGRACLLGIEDPEGPTETVLLVEVDDLARAQTDRDWVRWIRRLLYLEFNHMVSHVLGCERGAIATAASRRELKRRLLEGKLAVVPHGSARFPHGSPGEGGVALPPQPAASRAA